MILPPDEPVSDRRFSPTIPAMTTPDAHTVISVRAESQRIAAPDQASIYLTVLAVGDTKSAAASEVARVLGVVTAQLAELGGESLKVLTTRHPLTWSTQSIHTTEEHKYDQATGGQSRRTGRHEASANLLINVRDFQLLGRVESILTGQDMVNIGSVHWFVDHDNPVWAQVRADAIRAALHKGQDYATALAGSIISVEHVADVGLLAGDTPDRMAHRPGRDAQLSYRGAHTTSLDPVPQELSATIEARLTATIGPLPTH